MKKCAKIVFAFALCFLCINSVAFAYTAGILKLSGVRVYVNSRVVNTVPITVDGVTYLNTEEIASWLEASYDYNLVDKEINIDSKRYSQLKDGTPILYLGDTAVSTQSFDSFLKWNKYISGVGKLDQKGKAEFKDFVANELHSIAVLEYLARKNNLQLTSEDYDTIDKKMEQIKHRFRSNEEFMSYLNNQMGISYLDYYFIEQYNFLRQKVQIKMMGYISDRDLSAYYETYKETFKEENATVKHILLKTTDAEGLILQPEQKRVVENSATVILADIKKGNISFDQAIKAYSIDSSFASYPDGFLVREGDLQPEFEKAVFSTEQGKISNLVETKYGYHIIKVMSRDEYLPFESVKEEIKLIMSNEQFEKILQQYNKFVEMEIEKEVFDSYVVY